MEIEVNKLWEFVFTPIGIDIELIELSLSQRKKEIDPSLYLKECIKAVQIWINQYTTLEKQVFYHTLQYRIQNWIYKQVRSKFWYFYNEYDTDIHQMQFNLLRDDDFQLKYCTQLISSMRYLQNVLEFIEQVIPISNTNMQLETMATNIEIQKELIKCLRVHLFYQITETKCFINILAMYFIQNFDNYNNSNTAVIVSNEIKWLKSLLLKLDLSKIIETTVSKVVNYILTRVVKEKCATEESYQREDLALVKEWTVSQLIPWVSTVLGSLDSANESWHSIIHDYLIHTFIQVRMSQFFEIIRDFPESVPALHDVRKCLEQGNANLKTKFIHSVRHQLQTRLLHPGADTTLVLDMYVAMIKSLRVIDVKGVLLETLSGPVKAYLRQRKDTVRCIVISLTDDQQGELFDELRRSNLNLIQADDDSDDDDDTTDPDDWEPDSREADPAKSSASRATDDILRILVNIYGSRELFVSEYRLMLADKLLQNLSYDTEQDVMTLELLKVRFGEDSLHQCEIMVRDVEDAKRVNTSISNELKQPGFQNSINAFPMDSMIVSHHFWPLLQSEDFVPHPAIHEVMKTYEKVYSIVRNPRSLVWKKSLGKVQLTIELDNGKRDFSVSTLQATIIMHFEDQKCWIVNDLAIQLEITEDELLRAISVWINHGILYFTCPKRRSEIVAAEMFAHDYSNTNKSEIHEISSTLTDEDQTAVSSDRQDEEALRTYESYIVGMLTNFGSLNIQRIHNMLSTFARSGAQPYDKTISSLSALLDKLVNSGKLELVGHEYQLAKK